MEEDKKYVSLRLGTARRPSIKTRMKGSKPIIDVSVFLEGDILSIDGDQDYSTGEGLTELEQFVSDYMKRNVTEFLIKTRDEFKSDICATGRPLKKTFLLWDDWIAFKWMDKYPKAEFNVDVKVLVRRSGVMTNQVPLSHMKGKDK